MSKSCDNMKMIFETEDQAEAMRILKANDMASFIWQLVNNGWRDFKHTDYEYEKAWAKINELLEQHNINPDELME
jgi:hypothetical protein